jgi:hypothetical protein
VLRAIRIRRVVKHVAVVARRCIFSVTTSNAALLCDGRLFRIGHWRVSASDWQGNTPDEASERGHVTRKRGDMPVRDLAKDPHAHCRRNATHHREFLCLHFRGAIVFFHDEPNEAAGKRTCDNRVDDLSTHTFHSSCSCNTLSSAAHRSGDAAVAERVLNVGEANFLTREAGPFRGVATSLCWAACRPASSVEA